MSIQLLEREQAMTPSDLENVTESSRPSFTFHPTSRPRSLSFEWHTTADESNDLTWHGDIDAVLGLPAGAFPRTFSAWVEVIDPADRDAVLNAVEAHLLSDKQHYIECRARCFDGSTLCWEYSGRATRDENGNPVSLCGTLDNIVWHPHSDEHPQNGNSNGHGRHLDGNGYHLNGNGQVAGQTVDALVEAPTEPEELALSESLDDGLPPEAESLAVGMVSQRAESESAEQRASSQEARAQSLLRAAAHLNAQLDLQQVCDAICEEAARTIGAPSAVMLFSKSRDAFVPTSVRGMPVDYDKRYIPTPRSVYEGHVAEMGTLFLFTDAQATPDLPNHTLYTDVNMRTIGIASLIREGEVLGLLKVYSFVEPRTFTANELALLQGLADIAAQAIANARLLAESKRRLANLNALREIDKAILGSSDVNLSLAVVLEQVVTRMGAHASSALLLDPHTRTLRYAVGRGFRTSSPRRTDWQLGEGLAGRAALEHRIVHIPDLSNPEVIEADFTDPDLKLPEVQPELHPINSGVAPMRRSGLLPNEGFVSYHGIPLIANGQVKGVLEVWHRAPFELDEEELEFLETLAGQAAIAVDNAMLFRDLQRSNDELILAYDSTLRGWSGALDLRDKETEGHSERVTRETLRLAREMGIRDAELVHVRRGALLHDIGKMGVPDAILLKPGPLTDEEWVIMKQHPTHAFELLSRIEYLRPALDIPYAHHEKWDGSGYPRKLSGEQIPLVARIFAVVDVWDALCSDRPYRKGWPIARVLNHIREGSGTHFDPDVVKAFLQLHEHELEPLEEPGAPPALASPSPSATVAVPQPSLMTRIVRFILGSDPA